MIGILLLASATTASPNVDQTTDVALVAQYLSAIRSDAFESDFLAPNVVLINKDTRSKNAVSDFSVYANSCPISKIATIKYGLPLNVEWSCRRPEEDRHANVWITDGKISKISWGRIPVVVLPTIKPLEGAK